MLFGIVKMGNFGLKQPKMFFKIVISKVKIVIVYDELFQNTQITFWVL